MAEHQVSPAACPWCGYEMDGASNLTGDRAPEPGNIMLCLKCASPLQFVEGGGLAKIADREIRDRLSADGYQHFLRARRALLKVDRSKVGSDA